MNMFQILNLFYIDFLSVSGVVALACSDDLNEFQRLDWKLKTRTKLS